MGKVDKIEFSARIWSFPGTICAYCSQRALLNPGIKPVRPILPLKIRQLWENDATGIWYKRLLTPNPNAMFNIRTRYRGDAKPAYLRSCQGVSWTWANRGEKLKTMLIQANTVAKIPV